MASSQDYLQYVLDLLRYVPNVTYKKMMGEYLLYADAVLFGGVYDDRFLVKKTPSTSAHELKEVSPYPGAKMMLVVDSENPFEVEKLVLQIIEDLHNQ